MKELKKGDIVKTSLSDNTVVLNLEGRDALLFAGNGFVQVKDIQYIESKWEWSSGKYYDNINQIKNDKNYDTIRTDIADNIENHYEDTIKAIISIEKNINNYDMLDYLYDMYMKNSNMLLNNSIDEAISDYLNDKQNERQNDRKTLKGIKNDIDNYKNNEIKNSAVKKDDKMNCSNKKFDKISDKEI